MIANQGQPGTSLRQAEHPHRKRPWVGFHTSGTLPSPLHDPSAPGLPFEARRLRAADVDAVYALHLEVVSQMSAPGLVRRDTRDYFAAHIEDAGFILGTFCEDRLVGYGLSSFPRDELENYGVQLKLPAHELPLVGQLEGAAVGVEHWGRGLHLMLAGWRADCLAEAGFRHICATVAPGNVWSLRNLLRTGLVIRHIGVLYGGLLRYVLQQDRHLPPVADVASSCMVPLDNLDRQRELIADGYFCHACTTHGPGNHTLTYSRPEGA